MNKLLLSSVSVMAFVSAATAASETPQPSDNSALQQIAKSALESTVSAPVMDMTSLVKQQAVFTLNEEKQRLLGKGLYVMNEKRATRGEAQSE